MCFDVLRGDYHIVFIAGLVHRDGFGGREWTVAFSAPLEDIRTGCSGRALARPVTIVGLIRLTPLFLVICYQLLKQRFEHDNKHKADHQYFMRIISSFNLLTIALTRDNLH